MAATPAREGLRTGFKRPAAFGAPGSLCGLASVRCAHSRQTFGDPEHARIAYRRPNVSDASVLGGFAGTPTGP